MIKKFYLWRIILPILCFCLLLGAAPIALAAPEAEPDPTASAATDLADNTPVDTVADKLVIQLGPTWAGVEFELHTDYGLYPGTIVVDESGFLKMELGGSKTYTISCLSSSVPVPSPDPAATEAPDDQSTQSQSPDEDGESSGEGDTGSESKFQIPPMHLILFIGGMVICIGALIAMRVVRKRREASYQEDEDDED